MAPSTSAPHSASTLPSGAYRLTVSMSTSGNSGFSFCVSGHGEPPSFAAVSVPTPVQVNHIGNTIDITPDDPAATFRMQLQMSGANLSALRRTIPEQRDDGHGPRARAPPRAGDSHWHRRSGIRQRRARWSRGRGNRDKRDTAARHHLHEQRPYLDARAALIAASLATDAPDSQPSTSTPMTMVSRMRSLGLSPGLTRMSSHREQSNPGRRMLRAGPDTSRLADLHTSAASHHANPAPIATFTPLPLAVSAATLTCRRRSWTSRRISPDSMSPVFAA